MTNARIINMCVSGRQSLGWALLVLSCMYILYIARFSDDKICPEEIHVRHVEPNDIQLTQPQQVNNDNDELSDLRLNWIYPPGPGYGQVVDNSQAGQSKFIDSLLNQKENGFFVECGAQNGLKLSNTIFFETKRNWTGLLVEAERPFFENIISLHRKAYAINACMSPSKNSGLFAWRVVGGVGGLQETHVFHQPGQRPPDGYMQCFSFGTMMAALNVKRVDYFSLDIEGGEVPVLKTIPWNDVYIDVLSIEYKYVGVSFYVISLVSYLCKIRVNFTTLRAMSDRRNCPEEGRGGEPRSLKQIYVPFFGEPFVPCTNILQWLRKWWK